MECTDFEWPTEGMHVRRDRTFNQGFDEPLVPATLDELRRRAHEARGTILTATSAAASGHPGGSMSSIEMYTLLHSCAYIRPDEPRWPLRDRIIVSHGHTSPGVYTALAYAGYFDPAEVEAHFRQVGSVFEGHVERSVPGIEWSSGNLGQGLSAGVGMALGARLTGGGWHTYVAMSDGEQHKGQVAEARRLAVRQGLVDLTVLVDLNGIQISGRTADIMPVDVAADFAADGWRVIEVDGHDIEALYAALVEAVSDRSSPVCIICHTVIGKGVTFMEGRAEFHGRGLSAEEYALAMGELGIEPRLDEATTRRSAPCQVEAMSHLTPALRLSPGTPVTYAADKRSDNRSAWGSALVDLARTNAGLPVAVLDCDLAVSVKTDAFAAVFSDSFIQCGVGEHNAATVGGALSTCGVLTFWADFGVFGCDEAYNQQRLNDINGAALKLVLTHCGLDVGEDGKTHQCLDYVAAWAGMFGWKVIVPADPNQTDRAVRYAAAMQGNVCVAMGRSKLDIVLDSAGEPLFAGDSPFEYGRIVWARLGADACLLVMGTPSGAAVRAADMLADAGLAVAVGIVACPLALDDDPMRDAYASPLLLTIEDHGISNGLGAAVAQWGASNRLTTRLEHLGVDSYRSSGAASDLYAQAGLDDVGIARLVREALGR